MSSETMFEKLDRYYQEQGIPAIGFNCKHRDACSAVCAPGQMISVPEAYVGPGYEVGNLPRLLFISSDTNSADHLKGHPEWGALRAEREDRVRHHRWAPAKTHWGKTLNLAGTLLAPFAIARLGKNIDRDKVVEYIAHARSTRCKDNSIGKGEGNSIMSANCCEFARGEVVAMQPDIIVTQGKRAREALEGVFHVIQQLTMTGFPNTYYQIVQLEDNHTAIKIVAKHPCARGRHGWKHGEWKQFEDWAAKSVQDFISVA